jgi:hypothetical protein
MLNALELTGRADTHVRRDETLGAVLHAQAAAALATLRAAAAEAGVSLFVI